MNQILIITTLSFLLCTTASLDYQRHLQYESTLDHIIRLVREDRLQEFSDTELRRCTESKCCICGSEFKNATFAGIHIALHHHDLFNHTEEVGVLFEQSIPEHERYEYCHQYLREISLSHQQREDVCIVISQGYYRPRMTIIVVKYILYVVVGLLAMIYYSDIAKSNKS